MTRNEGFHGLWIVAAGAVVNHEKSFGCAATPWGAHGIIRTDDTSAFAKTIIDEALPRFSVTFHGHWAIAINVDAIIGRAAADFSSLVIHAGTARFIT